MSRAPEYSHEIRQPREFSGADLDAFAECVRKGGKVSTGVRARLPEATHLGVVRYEGDIVGTAAIKRPTSHHREECFNSAGSDASPDEFPLEFGWAFMMKEHRDAKLISGLITELIGLAGSVGIYSTTQTTNDAMLHMLKKNGFIQSGSPYASKLQDDAIVLFLRSAKGAE